MELFQIKARARTVGIIKMEELRSWRITDEVKKSRVSK